MNSIYNTGLDRNPANYTALSPLPFVRRARDVYPEKPAMVCGDRRLSRVEPGAGCISIGTGRAGQ